MTAPAGAMTAQAARGIISVLLVGALVIAGVDAWRVYQIALIYGGWLL